MTPKEKAEQLIETFRMNVLDYEGCGINDHKAKQCALIAVDELILEQCKGRGNTDARYQDERLRYWQEVKQEIVEQQKQN